MLKGTVRITGKTDAEVAEALKKRDLNLAVSEARRVCELLGRDPTIVELTIFNTMWSEHCSYKSSRRILGEMLPTKASNVVMGPGEDAGVVRFARADDGDWHCLVIAHESHNHPSQLLPVEGAATGIGGIVRDVYCMGADVVGVLDPLRFGDPSGENAAQTISIARGVVDGIAQYGNALGVPNLGGDVVFDRGYDENCLVNVVAIGTVKESRILRSRVPEEASSRPYKIILVGKPTDDSGFGGAAFASEDLASEEEANRGAVQVPDPFLKRVLTVANRKVLELAWEKGHKIGFKDLGAGGISCVTSELADSGGFGVKLDLDMVNVAAGHFPAAVIACSETQERYALAVPDEFVEDVLRIYNSEFDLPHIYHGAGAFVVGDVMTERKYTIVSQGEIVCEAPIEVITTGISYDRAKRSRRQLFTEPDLSDERSLRDDFIRLFSSVNISSKNHLFHHYDSEVQGRAVLRPGEADAGVIAPVAGMETGIAVSVDGNPRYGMIDPYQGGAHAVIEAARNVAAVGAEPWTITDCLNYGNPEKEEVFWEFYEGVRGIGDACKGIGLISHEGEPLPVVSGNVSFYNQGESGKAIPPSPIIACVGVVRDYSRSRSIGFKEAGNTVYYIGEPLDELGGSEYYSVIYKELGANVPEADFIRERNQIRTVIEMHDLGWIRACHDSGQGGMLTAIAEMVVATRPGNRIGLTIDMDEFANTGLSKEKILFSETGGFVVELPAGIEREVLALCARARVRLHRIGSLNSQARLEVTSGDKRLAAWESKELKEAYMNGCRSIFGIEKGA
ncbi:MAG: phosphoribosylformylglycinamidine synthase subunit PurL [Candidatus Krumholzibacteriota bacterium]|nr:phosphoribosylformylglycinamidine synthase subunit PurL [Candidatus Krumholzibacteriota bacterium]